MSEHSTERKSNKAEKTRQMIVETFLEFISEKKWDKISVKEVCSKAGITRGTFYQYFSSTYDLMEQLEEELLDEVNTRYSQIPAPYRTPFPPEKFVEEFNYAPPAMLTEWFDFCQHHKKAIYAMLDRKHGDTYFVKKLKGILTKYINQMMDADGLPRDELRSHFIHIFLELHFMAAQTWIASEEDSFLSINEIVALLNNMRVGSSYMWYKEHCDPDYQKKMGF